MFVIFGSSFELIAAKLSNNKISSDMKCFDICEMILDQDPLCGTICNKHRSVMILLHQLVGRREGGGEDEIN